MWVVSLESKKAGMGKRRASGTNSGSPCTELKAVANLPCRDASGTWHLQTIACGEIGPRELTPHKKPFVKTPIFAPYC